MAENTVDEYLVSLIMNFQMSAMVGMGKLINPVTNKTERSLGEAKVAIDMLEMLNRKTEGNLTAEEDRLLQTVLTELRLNYVNESAKPDSEPEKTEAGESENEKDVEPEEGEKSNKDVNNTGS